VLWGAFGLWTAAVRAAEAPAAAPAVSGVEVLGQVTLSLLLVVMLLLALAWALRRVNRLQPQGAASLRLVGGLSVGARERILLVEAEDKRLLVGVSPGGLRTLLVLEGRARADGKGAPQGFPGIQGASLAPPGRAG
jgi:flagellar protein FliO/FliZ